MGWASGSSLVSAVVSAFQQYEEDKDRKAFFRSIVEEFESSDWDTQDEVIGEDDDLDAVLQEMHPDWFEDEEEDEDE